MSATLLDGNALLEGVKDDLRDRIKALAARGVTPGLGTILVGDDPPSHAYVRLKREDSAEIGVRSVHTELAATVTQDELRAVIESYNLDPEVDAYILQVPLPDASRRAGRAARDRSGQGRRRSASRQPREAHDGRA